MPKPVAPEIQSPSSYLAAVRDTGQTLRQKFQGDPEGLAKRLGVLLPEKPVTVMKRLGVYDPERHGPDTPGLRDLVMDVCLREVTDACAVAGRGCGKSLGVSFIEFYLVFLELYDALNLGGSELQADQVYQYLLSYIDSDPYWRTLLKGEPQISRTETIDNAWIRVLTASSKSVRSPHAGGKKPGGRMAGGILVIDEEAEAERDIVESALPTINTARPSVNIRCSTFHNVEGSFADLIKNHEEMGYNLYSWNVWDVCTGCDCGPDKCESSEPCFREDHWEDYVDPETGESDRRLIHKAYCGGVARYANGWVPVEEIHKMWRRWKRNHTKFEVEAMGGRPSSKGYVIKSLNDFDSNIVDEPAKSLYLKGYSITICVDWGTVAAGIEAWQRQPGDKHVLIECEQLEEAGSTEIEARIVELWRKYIDEVEEVAADIGGGGNYMNPRLRDVWGLDVRDVNFAEEKESAVSAWNIYNEGHQCVYPAEFTEFAGQVRNWKRKNGRINKGNDHLCDTAICYFSKFVDELEIRRPPVLPRTASSAVDTKVPSNSGNSKKSYGTGRAPVVRSLGRGSGLMR